MSKWCVELDLHILRKNKKTGGLEGVLVTVSFPLWLVHVSLLLRGIGLALLKMRDFLVCFHSLLQKACSFPKTHCKLIAMSTLYTFSLLPQPPIACPVVNAGIVFIALFPAGLWETKIQGWLRFIVIVFSAPINTLKK